MTGKRRCIICKEEHRADSKHFPAQTLVAVEVTTVKSRHPRVIEKHVQYVKMPICRKCETSHARKQFMQEHGIKADKTGAQRLMDMIRKKLEEIKNKGVTVEIKKQEQKASPGVAGMRVRSAFKHQSR